MANNQLLTMSSEINYINSNVIIKITSQISLTAIIILSISEEIPNLRSLSLPPLTKDGKRQEGFDGLSTLSEWTRRK